MGKASRRVHGPVTKQPPAAMTKKQLARGKKEARQLRIIWASVAAVAVIILAVVAWAIIKEAVVDPRQPVAKVNGHNISLQDYEPLLTYQRFRLHDNINALSAQLAQMDTTSTDNQFILQFYQQQLQQYESMLATAQESTLDELIDDELIREKANEAGLSVTSGEVSTYLHDQLAAAAAPATTVTNTAGITVTPTAIPQETLDQNYNNLLQAAQVSDAEFRRIIQRSLLRTKVQDLLASQVSTTGQIIQVQMIQIDVTPTITAALQTVTDTLQRVESGEDFATVAKEVSTLTDAKTNGGDLGWQAEGMLSNRYGTAVETLAFSLAAGQVGHVESNGKYYIVRVPEINPNGPLPEEALNNRRDSALTDWLTEQKKVADIQRQLSADQVPPDPFASQTTG
jgi:parvulin-like peptidyl-prolyl isomerase